MTRRSDRTTGLPRSRRRSDERRRDQTSRLQVGERTAHIAIISAAVALLAIVVLIMALGEYHDRWGHGREVILRVDEESATLSYFADRLFGYALESPLGGLSPEIGLMDQLEDELLTVQLARERSITLDDDATDAQISADLGIPVGGDRSAFDAALRNQLRTSRMSLSTYRRRAEARAARSALLDLARDEVGADGELISLRVVVVSDRETADAVLGRIQSGEDMGTIAQTDSIDLVSRTEDGLLDPKPMALLAPEIAAAIQDLDVGSLAGPISIDEVEFWVVRLEDRSDGTYSDSDREQLAQLRFDGWLDERRTGADIRRTADSGDYAWAAEHTG